MATLSPLDARVSFLTQAKQLMAFSSPSTSTYLAISKTQLATNQVGGKQILSTSCGACGSHDLKTEFESRANRGPSARSNAPVPMKKRKIKVKTIRRSCNTCNRSTRHAICTQQKPIPDEQLLSETIPAKDSEPSSADNRGGQLETSQLPDVKKSSKQRAKMRKEKTGLHTLLSQNRKDSGSETGLSLMDFMTKQ